MVLSRDDGGEFRGTSLTGTSSGGLLRTSAGAGGLLRRYGLSTPSPAEEARGEVGVSPPPPEGCCVPWRGKGGGPVSPGRCLMVPTFSQANGRDSDETLDPLESFRRIRVPLGDSSPSDEEAELGVDMAGGGGRGACGASSSAPLDDGAAAAGGGGGGRGGSSRVVAMVNLDVRLCTQVANAVSAMLASCCLRIEFVRLGGVGAGLRLAPPPVSGQSEDSFGSMSLGS